MYIMFNLNFFLCKSKDDIICWQKKKNYANLQKKILKYTQYAPLTCLRHRKYFIELLNE